jgi:hypothetical protein
MLAQNWRNYKIIMSCANFLSLDFPSFFLNREGGMCVCTISSIKIIMLGYFTTHCCLLLMCIIQTQLFPVTWACVLIPCVHYVKSLFYESNSTENIYKYCIAFSSYSSGCKVGLINGVFWSQDCDHLVVSLMVWCVRYFWPHVQNWSFHALQGLHFLFLILFVLLTFSHYLDLVKQSVWY